MSHLTTELCVKYPGERIQQWEYDFEAREWAAIGFFPTALAERTRHLLPRACFFSQTGSKEDVLLAWGRIKSRLGRRVRLECTIGLSFGKDLEALWTPPAATPTVQPQERPAPVPMEEVLRAAFNKLFRRSDNTFAGSR